MTSTLIFVSAAGSISSCTDVDNDPAFFVFPSSYCSGTTCTWSASVTGQANFAGGSIAGTRICDGNEHPATALINGVSTTVGKYACSNGRNTLQTTGLCLIVTESPQIPTKQVCDILYYRTEAPATCLQMNSCDAAYNCLDSVGDIYECNNQVQMKLDSDTRYICNCENALVDTPTNTTIFPSGNPVTTGCGLALPPGAATTTTATYSPVASSSSSQSSSSPSTASSVPTSTTVSVGPDPRAAGQIAASQAMVAWSAADRASSLGLAAAQMPTVSSLAALASNAAVSALSQASLARAYASSASSLAHQVAQQASQATTAFGVDQRSLISCYSEASEVEDLAAGASSTADAAYHVAQNVAYPTANAMPRMDNGGGSGLNVGALVGGLLGGLVGLGLLLLLAYFAWRRRHRNPQVDDGEAVNPFTYEGSQPVTSQDGHAPDTAEVSPVEMKEKGISTVARPASVRPPSQVSAEPPQIPPVGAFEPLEPTSAVIDENTATSLPHSSASPAPNSPAGKSVPTAAATMAEAYGGIEAPTRAYHPAYGGFDPDEDPMPQAPTRYSLNRAPSSFSYMTGSRASYASSLSDIPPDSPGLGVEPASLEARLAAYESRPTLGRRRTRAQSVGSMGSDPFQSPVSG